MLTPVASSRFRRDLKKCVKRGRDIAKLDVVLHSLIEGRAPPSRYKDHPLRGRWQSYRDLLIEPDWLLIYAIVGDELRLARTGSHADLFEE